MMTQLKCSKIFFFQNWLRFYLDNKFRFADAYYDMLDANEIKSELPTKMAVLKHCKTFERNMLGDKS